MGGFFVDVIMLSLLLCVWRKSMVSAVTLRCVERKFMLRCYGNGRALVRKLSHENLLDFVQQRFQESAETEASMT